MRLEIKVDAELVSIEEERVQDDREDEVIDMSSDEHNWDDKHDTEDVSVDYYIPQPST